MWVLPSLDRANLLKEFFSAYKEAESTTPGLVLVDKTDPQKEQYLKMDYPKGWRLILTDAILMGDKVREVWDQVKDYEWIGILNDDHRPRTKAWDQKVIAQIRGYNVVCTNDGPSPDKPWNAPHRICGAICFSGPLLRTLGWMFPPGLNHFYSDDVWGFLFGRTRACQFLMDVCVEHDHAYKDPKKRDATYHKINGNADFTAQEPDGGLWKPDREALKKWFETSAQQDLKKVMDLQPKEGVMVATPSHDGNVSFTYALGLADTASNFAVRGYHFEMARVVGSSLIPHARNSLIQMFLDSKCQKLLFIDADQGYSKESVQALLNSNKRIIAGVTPHKRFPINLNFEPLEQDYKYFKDLVNKGDEEFFKFVKEKADANGEIEVAKTGTGFICIDRSVFEIMKDDVEEYLAFDNNSDTKHKEFFKMGAAEGRFRGEDWLFCSLAKKHGIPLFINANVLLSHQGTHNFMVNESLRIK